jgi:hypothetical protein
MTKAAGFGLQASGQFSVTRVVPPEAWSLKPEA